MVGVAAMDFVVFADVSPHLVDNLNSFDEVVEKTTALELLQGFENNFHSFSHVNLTETGRFFQIAAMHENQKRN